MAAYGTLIGKKMLTSLKCETEKVDQGLVDLLWCSTCREYKSKLCSVKLICRYGYVLGCIKARPNCFA